MRVKFGFLILTVSFVTIFFLYAFYYSITQSLGLNPIIGEVSFTLKEYQKIFTDPLFSRALIYTLKLSTIIGTLALMFSIIILFALFIFIEHPWMQNIFHTLRLPIYIPYIISSYMIFMLLMDNGFLQKSLSPLININFSGFINDSEGKGIILAYLWKVVPFFIMMAFPVLKRVHGHWNELAHLFQMNKISFFSRIILPLSMPSLLISLFIVVSYIFSSFEIPFVLGTINPQMISVYTYNIFTQGDLTERPYLMAMTIILTLISIIFGSIMYYIYHKWEKNIKGWY